MEWMHKVPGDDGIVGDDEGSGSAQRGLVGGEEGARFMVQLADGTCIPLAPYNMSDGRNHSSFNASTSIDDDDLSSDKKTSNADVKFCQAEFLHDNFELCPSSTLPRGLMYSQYIRYCRQHRIDPPMNSSSFGKLIRLVFAGIKTRRLGTRGNSKYQYYGVKIREDSLLHGLPPPEDDITGCTTFKEEEIEDSEGIQLSVLERQLVQFLGDPTALTLDISSLVVDDNELLPEGLTTDHLNIFEHIYRQHCEDILLQVSHLQLKTLPNLWSAFWSNTQHSARLRDESEDSLSADMLCIISGVESVQHFVQQADYNLYAMLVDVLLPDVLRPIPSNLTLLLRNFSKHLESWLVHSLDGLHEQMIKAKMTAVNAFAQLLRRYTSLNHLAQTARTVLQNSALVGQILEDLNLMNFTHIQEQAVWLCGCEDTLVFQLEADLKRMLLGRVSLDDWIAWLDNVSNHILQQHVSSGEFPRIARKFVLNWSLYSSLVLRDITLRGAPSFGSLHLVRLFFDEYLFYAVEHKVAVTTGIPPIRALGDMKQFVDRTSLPPLDLHSTEPYQPPTNTPFTFTPRQPFSTTPLATNHKVSVTGLSSNGNAGTNLSANHGAARSGVSINGNVARADKDMYKIIDKILVYSTDEVNEEQQ